MKNVLGITILGLAYLSLVAPGQEKPARQSSVGSLAVTSTLQIKGDGHAPFAGAIFGKPRCNDRAQVYVRLLDAETSKAHRRASTLPISKLNSDGTVGSTFNLPDSPPGLLATSLFVSGDGKVFMAARSVEEHSVYVISFASGVSSASVVKLQADYFIPYHIAVFKTGEFLLSGTFGPKNNFPYTAVFDPAGKLVRSIYAPEDEESRQKADLGEMGFASATHGFGNDFVMRGDADLGSDGNVYLLRATGLIYVISHTGQLLRKIPIQASDSGMVAYRLHASSGRLVVGAIRGSELRGLIEMLDYEGRTLATYYSDDSQMYPGLLACYGAQGFAFLGIDDGGVQISRAELK